MRALVLLDFSSATLSYQRLAQEYEEQFRNLEDIGPNAIQVFYIGSGEVHTFCYEATRRFAAFSRAVVQLIAARRARDILNRCSLTRRQASVN